MKRQERNSAFAAFMVILAGWRTIKQKKSLDARRIVSRLASFVEVKVHYHPDDFVRLSEQVEAEGGTCLGEPCKGKVVVYDMSNGAGGKERKRVSTTRCDMSARMDIPYDGSHPVRIYDKDKRLVDHKGEPKSRFGSVRVCAVDDAVGLWPRFSGIVSDQSFENTKTPEAP